MKQKEITYNIYIYHIYYEINKKEKHQKLNYSDIFNLLFFCFSLILYDDVYHIHLLIS